MKISHGTYRGMIALAAVIGAFILAMTQLVMSGDPEIPTWAGTLVGAIVAFYFGERAVVVGSNTTNGHEEKGS